MFWQEKMDLTLPSRDRQWLLDGPVFVNPYLGQGKITEFSVKPNPATSLINDFGRIAGARINQGGFIIIYPNLYLRRRQFHQVVLPDQKVSK